VLKEGEQGQVKLGTLENLIDPFCGGGSIPLEGQRLGMSAYGGDLNPVAVLISKALVEIPPKFAGHPPVNPGTAKSLMGHEWHGAQGLADDNRYYGKWMRDEAERRIGHLYPKVTLPKEYGNGEAMVIAWLWVRTVTCPNPACGAKMPLTSKWWLSKKKGKEVWVEPDIDHSITPPVIRFEVKTGKAAHRMVPSIGKGLCALLAKHPYRSIIYGLKLKQDE
jgi:putative DNA methylase